MSATIEPTAELSKLSLNEPQIKKLNETTEGIEVEDILKDSTRRFCLFPIKYHEVSFIDYSFSLLLILTYLIVRSGNSTRRLKPLSGLRKRLICLRTNTTGKPR